MYFKNEDHLQLFISKALTQLGKDNEREVWTTDRKGRIDILSDEYGIEVKPTLTRSYLFQAQGQLSTYMDSFPGRQPVIAGLAPRSESAWNAAESAASRLREQGTQVWFIDRMEEFNNIYYSAKRVYAPIEPEEEETVDYSSILLDLHPMVYIVGALAAFFFVLSGTNGARQQNYTQRQSYTAVVNVNAGERLQVRNSAGNVVGTLQRNQSVLVLGPVEVDGYVLVRASGVQGYVFASHLSNK